MFKDMHSMGAKPNVQIMDILLNQAYVRYAVADVRLFLEICENERIPVNKRLLDKLESFYQKYRAMIKRKVIFLSFINYRHINTCSALAF